MRMKIVFIALASLFLASPAYAQAVCGERAALLKQLNGKYKEAPISMGLAANGSVVEVTRSDQGTWTLLLTNPAGLTCLMAAGEHWEVLKDKKAKYDPAVFDASGFGSPFVRINHQILCEKQKNYDAWWSCITTNYSGVTRKNLTSDVAKIFVKTFNSIVPVTSYDPDKIVVVSDPRTKFVPAVFVKGGIIQVLDTMPLKAFETLKQGQILKQGQSL